MPYQDDPRHCWISAYFSTLKDKQKASIGLRILQEIFGLRILQEYFYGWNGDTLGQSLLQHSDGIIEINVETQNHAALI